MCEVIEIAHVELFQLHRILFVVQLMNYYRIIQYNNIYLNRDDVLAHKWLISQQIFPILRLKYLSNIKVLVYKTANINVEFLDGLHAIDIA